MTSFTEEEAKNLGIVNKYDEVLSEELILNKLKEVYNDSQMY